MLLSGPSTKGMAERLVLLMSTHPKASCCNLDCKHDQSLLANLAGFRQMRCSCIIN